MPALWQTAMTVKISALCDALGAQISGVDQSGDIAEGTFAQIRQAWLDHCLLLFRNVDWTPEQQIAFTRRFGPLHIMTPLQYNLPDHPEIFRISNVVEDGKDVGLRRAGWGWHSDGEDKQIPNAGSLLYAIEVPPEGGDTGFANMYRAYQALPEEVRARIEGRRVRTSRIELHHVHYPLLPALTEEDRRNRPDMYHPIVREHPETGRRSLYVGRWAVDIEGLPRDESRDLIAWLQQFSIQPEFVYFHKWRVGDALLWDNRCLLHCAMPFDDEKYRRYMHRTTLQGTVPVYGELRSAVAHAA
jgi:taurine dioxygenase